MDTSTVKGKVSAIRNIVSMGAIPMDKRLDYVREILGDQEKADASPPSSDLPSLPRITVKPEALEARKKELADRELARDKKEIKEILYPENKPYRKKIYQYDTNMNLIAVHDSIRSAHYTMGVTKGCIKYNAHRFGTPHQMKPIKGKWYVTWEENRPQ